MGHAIQFYTVEVNKGEKGKQEIEAIANEDAIYQSDSRSPLNQPIRWIDKVYEDYEAAEKGIEAYDNGWYDQLAVKYKEYEKVKDTKTIENLAKRLENYEKDLLDYKIKNSIVNRKSQFVGCDKCGSKINKKYVNSNVHNQHYWNTCPLCYNQLSSKTILDTIDKKEKRINETRSKLKEMRKNNERKGKHRLMWLVKTEFHV